MEIKELDAAILGVGNIAEKGERVFLYSPDEEIAYFLLHQESTATDERATTPQLPSELDSERARKYFVRAVEAGYMETTATGGKWLKPNTKAMLGYFCMKVFDKPRPLAAIEQYFDERKLSSAITQASYEPSRADVKKWRADMDSKIFFD